MDIDDRIIQKSFRVLHSRISENPVLEILKESRVFSSSEENGGGYHHP